MGLFDLFRKKEHRSIENPSVPLRAADIVSFSANLSNDAGVDVTHDTAMKVATYNACVRRISFDLGLLPFHVYRKTDQGRERATAHPNYGLLHDTPNEYMTSQVFRECVSAHILRYGNGYAYIEKQGERATGLYPLLPTRTRAIREKGAIYYVTILANGKAETLTADQVLHFPGLSFDGLRGRSVLEEAADVMGVAIAADQFAAKFFANGAQLRGYLTYPGKLSPDAKQNLKDSFAQYQGVSNAHGTPLFENGLELKEVGVPPEQAQFLETRVHAGRDVAKLFLMPPHKVGDLERATFSNIEHQAIEYVQSTLMRWIKGFENEVNRKLFWETEKGEYYAEMSVDGLLRGDQKTRYENYMKGIQGGWLSVNHIKQLENMNTIEGGDVHLSPLNMVDASKREEEDKRKLDPIFQDAIRRLLTKERNAIRRALKKEENSFALWANEFYQNHRNLVKQTFLPIVEAMGETTEYLEMLVDAHIRESKESIEGITDVAELRWHTRTQKRLDDYGN